MPSKSYVFTRTYVPSFSQEKELKGNLNGKSWKMQQIWECIMSETGWKRLTGVRAHR